MNPTAYLRRIIQDYGGISAVISAANIICELELLQREKLVQTFFAPEFFAAHSLLQFLPNKNNSAEIVKSAPRAACYEILRDKNIPAPPSGIEPRFSV